MTSYTLHVSFPASLPATNPAGWDATVRDIIELWHEVIERAGWSPIGESVDVALVDAPFDRDQRMITISGRIKQGARSCPASATAPPSPLGSQTRGHSS